MHHFLTIPRRPALSINCHCLQATAAALCQQRPVRLHLINSPRQMQRVESARQLAGRSCRVAGIFIKQQRDMPSTIVTIDEAEEFLKIDTSLTMTREQQAMTTSQVQGTEDHAPYIPPGQGDECRFSSQCPTGSQRWEKQQVRFILRQQHTAWRQSPDFAANLPFFSPSPDRALTHSGCVSKHNPTATTGDEYCPQRGAGRLYVGGVLAAMARSSSGASSKRKSSPSTFGWLGRTAVWSSYKYV